MFYKVSSIIFAASVSAAALKETLYSVHPPQNDHLAATPFDGFVSFSIEFSSFPDFAGNHSHPNKFSYNLLNNLKHISGHYPYIRVGGNTQDFTLYNASQHQQLIGIVDPARSPDYPTTITIGPSFFESYNTWPGVQYSHGFNLALGGNSSAGWETLVETVPLVCKALGRGKLYTWEYGNEPDLYSTSAQGPTRPKQSWTEEEYSRQWRNGTDEITKQVSRHCSHQGRPEFMAPSFAGLTNALNATKAWRSGLDKKKNIEYYSTHNYISGAASPGVTLQGTLMNHTMTKLSVNAQVAEWKRIFPNDKHTKAVPLIFGETNSLYNQGKPGLSNSFGAALWNVDFLLYSASAGFRRVHMHQGTNYRYQAWQPVDTTLATIGTKAPYYGNIAAASMLGPEQVLISEIPLGSDAAESAYAAHRVHPHRGVELARITVINMHGYNTTVGGEGLSPLPGQPAPRGAKTYSFSVPGEVRDGDTVRVQRLMANGSDAITGITFDGWSYNWDLDEGRPVRLRNVTTGETVKVHGGKVSVKVPDSSAALLSF